MHPTVSRPWTNVTECAQNVPLNVPWMFPECSLNVRYTPFWSLFVIFPWCLSTAVTGRHFGGWGGSGYSTWSEARSAQKLPLVPAVKLFLRGCVSIWRYKHTVPPLCRLIAHLQLIITMEALCDWTRSSTLGIRRLVLLTLVLGTHVCKLYSASTLVLL